LNWIFGADLYQWNFCGGRTIIGKAKHFLSPWSWNMSSASSASHGIRDAAKETARDAREGIRDIGKAAADASSGMEKDLQALRDDFARLAEQVADVLASKGNAAWARAKSGVESSVGDAMSGAQDTGQEAMDAVREVSDHVIGAIDESLKQRPYMTLAIVAGLGFLFGLTWRR
jgi:ElaB/YqjD/DUF883 family membrane-anchored ribosome-binding protein